MKSTIRFLTVFFSLTLVSCPFISRDDIDEPFSAGDRPYFQYNAASNYYYCLPWNYGKEWNSRRKYPLVVFLHGSGGAGNISYLTYLGYQDPASAYINETAYNFQTGHPCFVLIPQTPGSWDNAALIAEIEYFKQNYRINQSRLYLIGYSMGGSGSYSLANAYCDYNSSLFAGIVRLAGQSQAEVRNPIAYYTSIWMHIGLLDDAIRVSTTRDAYSFLRNHSANTAAHESTTTYLLDGNSVETKTLTRGNVEVAKISEYAAVGHGIVMLPAQDPSIMEWLFAQAVR
jgi:predicted peptidase